MQTTFENQIAACQLARERLKFGGGTGYAKMSLPEIDKGLNDAGSTIAAYRILEPAIYKAEAELKTTKQELHSLRIEMRESLMRLGNLIDKKNKIQAAELLGQLIKKLNT